MELQERFEKLLSDELFQEELTGLDQSSQTECSSFKSKYFLSDKEFLYAKKFFAGLAFNDKLESESDSAYALSRLNVAIHSLETENKLTSRLTVMDWIFRVAAFLTVPLFLSTFYFYQKSATVTDLYSYSGKMDVVNTFTAPLGAKTQIVLPDGSLVWLNSGSKLWCPQKFGAKSREVKLLGEAYFEVVKNEKVPMIISAGKINVNVYGTKFNLSAYEDDSRIETTLLEGKVTISDAGNGRKFLLQPGHSAVYDLKSEKVTDVKVENFDYYMGWKDGKIIFHWENLDEILKKLERWYGVNIQLNDPSLARCTFHATFNDEKIEQILEYLAITIPIKAEFPPRVKQPDGSYSKREIIIGRDTSRKLKSK